MNSKAEVGGYSNQLFATQRHDRWWIEPILTGAGFLLFSLYATWAAFQNSYYYADPYLSPFYSPILFGDPSTPGSASLEHAWFGAWPSWWPVIFPISPALLILGGPLSFRLTCYYYRKFYYRAYLATPPGCAVNPIPQPDYRGETRLFLFQNLHRFTLYVAIGFIIILSYDAYLAFFKNGKFGFGVGTLVLIINPLLLAGYTFGCHAFRHLVGGRADCFSCPMGKEHLQHKVWRGVSFLNGRHMMWAWISMIWVALADVYVRLVAMGIIHDWNTWD